MRNFPSTRSQSTKGTVRPSTWRDCESMGLVRSIAEALRRCVNCFPLLSRCINRNSLAQGQLGHEGEVRAARYLKKAGYKILYRNYRPHVGGEVDLVCRLPKELVLIFVEVKTRSHEDYGRPSEAVDFEKQRRIICAAQEWTALLDKPGIYVRFDVVEVLFQPPIWSINHIPSAFSAEETRHPGSQPLIPGASRGDVLPKHGRAGGGLFPPRPDRG